MNYTTNYQLPVWAETDRILMDDFNDMTEKIGDALDIHNCQIYTTTYKGTGQYGSGHPTALTFPRPPRMIFIVGSYDASFFIGSCFSNMGVAYYHCWAVQSMLCTGTAVSWYNTQSENLQMNSAAGTYSVVALLDAATQENL